MFASSITTPKFGPRPGRGLATRTAVIAAQVGLLVGFALIGMTFLGLTIAGPIAVPLAVRRGIVVSAADLATARQLAALAWVFALGAALSFVGAVVIIGSLIRHLDGPSGE